jgi:hypothetical protein
MAKPKDTLSQMLSRAISAFNAGNLVEARQTCQLIVSANERPRNFAVEVERNEEVSREMKSDTALSNAASGV